VVPAIRHRLRCGQARLSGIDRPLAFARWHELEIAGFELIEAADGRTVVCDVNTDTNYNPDVERVAPRSGPGAIAACLRRVETDVYSIRS
jgi:hypothetical protein